MDSTKKYEILIGLTLDYLKMNCNDSVGLFGNKYVLLKNDNNFIIHDMIIYTKAIHKNIAESPTNTHECVKILVESIDDNSINIFRLLTENEVVNNCAYRMWVRKYLHHWADNKQLGIYFNKIGSKTESEIVDIILKTFYHYLKTETQIK